MEGALVDKILFQFATCRCVPEIFTIKVESCQKSHQILDVFTPSEILGGVSPKSYSHFITAASWHIAWKKFCEDTPTSPEIIRANMLNFRPKFKFLQLKFIRGTSSPLGGALGSPGQSVARLKILGCSTPEWPKCSL